MSITSTTTASDEFELGVIQNTTNKEKLKEILSSLNEFNLIEGESYLLKSWLNDRFLGEHLYRVQSGKLCLSNQLEQTLQPYFTKTSSNFDPCLASRRNDHQFITPELNHSRSTITLWVETIHLVPSHESSQETRSFDEGLNHFLFNYTLSGVHYSHHSASRDSISSFSTAGVNLDRLKIRSRQSWKPSHRFQLQTLWAYYPVYSLNSEIHFGDYHTLNPMVDDFPFSGISLRRQKYLLNKYQRDYSPVIHGFAKTNALVEVYAGNSLLTSKVVAAGEFEISDITGLGNGVLEVVINEADGTQTRFYFNNTSITGMLTPGTLDYDLSLGRYRYRFGNLGDTFANGYLRYGFNLGTPFITTTFSEHYHTLTLGSAFPAGRAGAFSAAASHSQSQYQTGESVVGHSLMLQYLYALSSHFDLRADAFHDLSGDYYSFQEFMENSRHHQKHRPGDKLRWNIGAGIRVPWFSSQLSVNYGQTSSWRPGAHSDVWYLGYSGRVGPAHFNISFSRQMQERSNLNQSVDQSLSLRISLPIDAYWANNIYTRFAHQGGTGLLETGLAGTIDPQTSFQTALSRQSNNSVTGQASLSHHTPSFNLTSSGYTSEHASSMTGSITGGVITTLDNLYLTGNSSETRTLVRVEPHPDITVNGQPVKPSGYAVIHARSDYGQQQITLNQEQLPINVQVDNPSLKLMPSKGSLTLAEFRLEHVIQMVVRLVDKQGAPLPLGSIVQLNGNGFYVGMDGYVLISLKTSKKAKESELNHTLVYMKKACLPAIRTLNIDSSKLINQGQMVCETSD